MDWSDSEAVERSIAGDQNAYRVLVERHSRNVFKLGFRMMGNEQDAEEVVQETFLRAWRQLKTFDGRASFSTWTYRIASNYSRDVLRMKRRRSAVTVGASNDPDQLSAVEAAASQAPTPDRLTLSGQIQGLMRVALEKLSEMERTAFLLRHYEGLGMEEIGRVLGTDSNAAKQSVFRAVQKLRRALEPAAGYSR